MIRLPALTEPVWIDLGSGVRVKVLPFTSALMLAIRADYRREIADLPQDGEPLQPEDLGLRFNLAVARHAIIDWEGVGDENGDPLACTPEGVAALMSIYQFLKAFDGAYVSPRLTLDAEKNVSSPGQNGTSARVVDKTTAPDAQAPAPSAPTH
jgi:hypothetical protein